MLIFRHLRQVVPFFLIELDRKFVFDVKIDEQVMPSQGKGSVLLATMGFFGFPVAGSKALGSFFVFSMSSIMIDESGVEDGNSANKRLLYSAI